MAQALRLEFPSALPQVASGSSGDGFRGLELDSCLVAVEQKRPDRMAPVVKTTFRNASILKDGRVVFNLAGNKYRLVVWINYPYRVVYVRFVGTHAQYDVIDGQTM